MQLSFKSLAYNANNTDGQNRWMEQLYQSVQFKREGLYTLHPRGWGGGGEETGRQTDRDRDRQTDKERHKQRATETGRMNE